MNPPCHSPQSQDSLGQRVIALVAIIAAAMVSTSDNGQRSSQELVTAGLAPLVQQRILEAYGNFPLSFEPNQGQTDERAKFISRGLGYTLFLTADEAVLAVTGPKTGKQAQSFHQPFSPSTDGVRESGVVSPSAANAQEKKTNIVRLKLLGSNPAPLIRGREALPGKSNYFTGNDSSSWLSNLPNYGRVEYKDVYPGIDLVYYGNQHGLEYDFVVAPRANYKLIRLAIEGAEGLEIDESGNLSVGTPEQHLRILRPRVYQDGVDGRDELKGEFVLRNENEIAFTIAPHDVSRPLIIDPVVAYSFWTGDGTADEQGARIAVDRDGNVYITGGTRSASFPIVNAFQSVLGGGGGSTKWDAFITKVNASGTAIVYSTFLGGSGDDAGSGIAVDTAGRAVIVGATKSTGDFPLKNPLTGGHPGDTTQVFITKLSAAGSELVFSTLLGGSRDDGSNKTIVGAGYWWAQVSVAVDGSGNAFVAGPTESVSDFPLVNPIRSNGNAFLAKLNTNGSSLLYSTYLGSENIVVFEVHDLAVDRAGNAYVAGMGTGPGGGDGSAFLEKVNPSGSGAVFSKLYGGSSGDVAFGVGVDTLGNAYLAGWTWSSDFPVANAFQSTLRGTNDAFVAKFDASGQVVYSTFLGGGSTDVAYGVSVDRSGNAYVTGSTTSADFPMANPTQGTMGGGGYDAFVSCLNPVGDGLVFSTFLGGNSWDFGHGITVDAVDAAYALGWSSSSDFPTTVPKTYPRGIYIVKFGLPTPGESVQVWQELRLSSAGSFKSHPDSNIVSFDSVKAVVTRVSTDTISVLVPPELVKNRTRTDLLPDTTAREVTVIVRVIRAPGDTAKVLEKKCLFIPPRLLIHDEVTRAAPPVRQGVLLGRGWRIVQTYIFLGYRTDGYAAVRLTNTSTTFPPPISLLGKVISPPPITLFDGSAWPSVGNLLNVGNQNAAIQFPIEKDGWYIIVVVGGPLPNPPVFPEVPNSPGPFPAQFQIHLAGNVGLPRKLINGVPEWPRGIRLDTYFNHPAPRTETLGNNGLVPGEWAETGLFKFGNPVSVSQYPIAVLIPPIPGGFPVGTPPVRAAAPLRMGRLPNGRIDITVPMATTPGAADPVPGTVIDLAQVPIPASVLGPGPPPGVAMILGAPNGNAFTLPYTATAGTISSLIVDMGSGNEIVDGTGPDVRVIALSGTYLVAVSNTPFDTTFVTLGSGTGQQEFDLSGSGLTSARYVRLMVTVGTANFDAVEALNLFTDQIHPTAGPLADVGWATITMRHRKSPATSLDPYIELIGPDGSALGKNDSGFGDDLDPSRSDAALIKIALTQLGFYRFLGRGYDVRPDAKAFGTYYARLETAGEYDPQEITISSNGEDLTPAQRQGTITLPRQRDSYLFQASAGTTVHIVVNGVGTPALPDPIVELYDPEDFLIGANDDYPARGKNSALSVSLPTTGRTFPDPSTYRIVVMGIDKTTGTTTSLLNSVCYVRQENGGKYELKVFTGPLSGGVSQSPGVSSVSPDAAVRGAKDVIVTVTGTNFVSGASASISGSGVTVKGVSFVSAVQLKVRVDVDQSAATGKRDLTVTNPDGKSGTGVRMFEVRTTLGAVALTWEAPEPGVATAPPRNLQSSWGGGGTMPKGNATVTHTPVPSGNRVKSHDKRTTTASLFSGSQTPAITINEVEPNNTIGQAQVLAGDTLITVTGNAEVRDTGELFGIASDDIEDLFKVTTSAIGLSIRLDGFSSDCDLYLFDLTDTSFVSESYHYGATTPEEIDIPDLPAGNYIVGVSIYDSDPIGPDSTAYSLHVRGTFTGGGPTALTSYSVYRSITSNARSTGVLVGSVPAGTLQWSDAIPYAGRFYYQLTALYGQTESVPSNETSELVTFVAPPGGTSIPESYALLPNYPNPFNPGTVIRYHLPIHGGLTHNVQVSIFNTLGQEVRRLVERPQQAGIYEAYWDGKDEAGKLLPSGIYFYRFVSGEFRETRKMVLLK